MTRVLEWAQAEFPDSSIWIDDRRSMTDYAIEKAIKMYRRRAKEEPENRTHYLREAWRLRWLLRMKVMIYRSAALGKSICIVPFVPKDSPLQYQNRETIS